MSVYLFVLGPSVILGPRFVPSVFGIILSYIYAHEWFCHK